MKYGLEIKKKDFFEFLFSFLQTFLRVRTSRQQRLNGNYFSLICNFILKNNGSYFLAKLQLHNRRSIRNDTRSCPICYQPIPINSDEEYFFTHVQQCSRKVNKTKKIILSKLFLRENNQQLQLQQPIIIVYRPRLHHHYQQPMIQMLMLLIQMMELNEKKKVQVEQLVLVVKNHLTVIKDILHQHKQISYIQNHQMLFQNLIHQNVLFVW